MAEHAAGRPGVREAVEVLRAAVEVLRSIARNLPRGPWWWGDPDVGDESGAGPLPRPEPWPVLPSHRWPNPLDEPVGFQNPAMAPDQRFQAAGSYSLSRPPRTGQRRILPCTGSGHAIPGAVDAAAALDG